jgi:hypothetical protein
MLLKGAEMTDTTLVGLPLNLEDYKVEKSTSTTDTCLNLDDYRVGGTESLQCDLSEYQEYVKNMRRFKTHEEFLEFSRHNFVFYRDDLGMRLQQVIENEEQFVNFLQRCCMLNYPIEDNPWLMWLVNDPRVVEEYLSPTEQLIQRHASNTGLNEDVWIVDGEELQYYPDQPIEAWQADYNEYFEEPFEVHKTSTKVFLPGDFSIKEEYKSKMPFLARFVSHNTWDRAGSIKGQDLDIIPLSSLNKDVISIH